MDIQMSEHEIAARITEHVKRQNLEHNDPYLARTLMYAKEMIETFTTPIDCHCMSMDDARIILILSGFACDVLSPSGFIHWLKRKMNEDKRLHEAISCQEAEFEGRFERCEKP